MIKEIKVHKKDIIFALSLEPGHLRSWSIYHEQLQSKLTASFTYVKYLHAENDKDMGILNFYILGATFQK